MLQTKVLEKIKTQGLCSVNFFNENCAVYEIMCQNVVQPDRPQMTKQYGAGKMRFAFQMTNASTQAHSRNL